jgi:arabinan endo-1,5-alpha-L-arabinosidase
VTAAGSLTSHRAARQPTERSLRAPRGTGITVGTPAATTWLRLVQRTDPVTGVHRIRGESSTDGRTWTLSGVWTFPAGPSSRIGLVAHGGATPPVTARFDYLRVSQP